MVDNMQENITSFQKNLNDNKEDQTQFIYNKDDSDIDSDSEYNLTLPKKAKKGDTINYELLYQIINQQNNISNVKKKVYKLQSELDQTEIKTRYLKLDLNNAQIEISEYKEQQKDINKRLYISQLENWIVRITTFMCISIYIYNFIKN